MIPAYDPEMAMVLQNIMKDVPGAKPGKMFGMPAFMVNGKLAVGVYSDGVVAKVGEQRAKALAGKNGVEGAMMRGRPWKEWVRVSGDLAPHRALFEEAVRYVAANG